MSKWAKILATSMGITAVMILAYAVLTPQTTDTDTDHMGMWGGRASYSSVNVGLIALSTVMIVTAVIILVFRQEYEPLPPTTVATTEATIVATKGQGSTDKAGRSLAPAPHSSPDETAAREYLILRLLTGDERTMFKAVMDSGGEALQKDLIVRTKMSNAKVSRLLDKLEQKDVITKERYGATNKIKLRPE